MKYTSMLLSGLVLVAFQNCGQVSYDQEGEEEVLSVSADEQFKNDVAGIWTTPCTHFPSYNAYYKIRAEFVKVGGDLRVRTTSLWHSDNSCTQIYLSEEQIRNVSSLTESAGGFQIFGELASQSVTLHTQAAVNTSNSQMLCGLTNWVAGVTQSTRETTCRRPLATADIIQIRNGQLFRALDEVHAPTVATGVSVGAMAYTR